MGLIESVFDLTYLLCVTGLGVRLLIEKDKNAKLFGFMAIILGTGDAFHLIPRIISHLSPGGFEAHRLALSYGKMITGITMTIFYLLFYFYYREITRDKDNYKKWMILGLATIRIVLILLVQNNWSAGGSCKMGIIRNIPFLIMGMLLMIFSYRKKHYDGLKHMSFLIFLSFLFYVPVVVLIDKVPAIGAFMIPKTVAYILIVVEGFKHFIKDFDSENLFNMAITYAIMGLCGGVFYREFTKYYKFTQATHLGKLHVHTLVLGMALMSLFYILTKKIDKSELKKLKKPLNIYNFGLIFTITNMMLIGIYEVVSNGVSTVSSAAMDGISGIGHIFLGVGLVYTLIMIKKLTNENDSRSEETLKRLSKTC